MNFLVKWKKLHRIYRIYLGQNKQQEVIFFFLLAFIRDLINMQSISDNKMSKKLDSASMKFHTKNIHIIYDYW